MALLVTALADSAVNVTLRCWASPDDWQNTRFDLTKTIKERFDAAGLRFPYPHQVLLRRTAAPPRGVDFAGALGEQTPFPVERGDIAENS